MLKFATADESGVRIPQAELYNIMVSIKTIVRFYYDRWIKSTVVWWVNGILIWISRRIFLFFCKIFDILMSVGTTNDRVSVD